MSMSLSFSGKSPEFSCKKCHTCLKVVLSNGMTSDKTPPRDIGGFYPPFCVNRCRYPTVVPKQQVTMGASSLSLPKNRGFYLSSPSVANFACLQQKNHLETIQARAKKNSPRQPSPPQFLHCNMSNMAPSKSVHWTVFWDIFSILIVFHLEDAGKNPFDKPLKTHFSAFATAYTYPEQHLGTAFPK